MSPAAGVVARLEHLVKQPVWGCQMCGQCVLHSTGLTCPMTCPKTLRNGPCGGVRANGRCEVKPEMVRVWLKAYERSERLPQWRGHIDDLRPPVDNTLQGSSAGWEYHLESKESRMDTLLRSRSRSVTIGAAQPFCVIGERINPTGRKQFAEELRAGDLSTVTVDALAQVQAGANMLDVNAGIPLVDEPELLKAMLRTVQDAVDVPICIDSSVIEALSTAEVCVQSVRAADLLLGHDAWGASWIAAHRGRLAAEGAAEKAAQPEAAPA